MSLPRVSWHIGDYLKDTNHLRALGHGAYFMLCLHYYATGGLPDDDKQLAAIARLTDKEWKDHKPTLQAFFHDGWLHNRIDKELKLANAKYEARAAAGKRGGEAKANNKQNPSNATAKPKQPITYNLSTEANASLVSSSEDSLEIKEGEEEQACGRNGRKFDEFWAKYPHKVGKLDARKAFAKALKAVEFEKLMSALDAYVGKTDDRPWCNPATWLNQGRWDDKPALALNGHAAATPAAAPPSPAEIEATQFKKLDFHARTGTWPFDGPDPASPRFDQQLLTRWLGRKTEG